MKGSCLHPLCEHPYMWGEEKDNMTSSDLAGRLEQKSFTSYARACLANLKVNIYFK